VRELQNVLLAINWVRAVGLGTGQIICIYTQAHRPVCLRRQKGHKLMLASWKEMMDKCREIHWEQHLQLRLILLKLGMLTGLLFVFWSVQLGLVQCSFFMIVLRCTIL